MNTPSDARRHLTPLLGTVFSLAGGWAVAAGVPAASPDNVPPLHLAQLVEPRPGSSLDETLTPQLVPLEVTVNGAKAGNFVLLERGGHLYATADTLLEWRLAKPALDPVVHRGQSWYPLAAVPGYQVTRNPAEQSAALRFAPDAFAATRLVQQAQQRPALSPMVPSVFANYDLSYTRTTTRTIGSSVDAGALLELGTSGNWGLVTSTFLGRNLIGADPVEAPREFRRLETTYTLDLPASNLTLRLGDSVTRPSSWGRAVYFGGLQLGRNFGLAPGFISQPLPVLSGVSATPSTVDLYINDALRQTSQVPAGPFAINNFPVVTGGGQARMVVRDVLGRETVIVQDFFSHSSLLEQDLTDWSVELGAVRNQLGVANARYGQAFASGLWRHGISKALTLEAKGEAGTKTRGLGLGVVAALPFQVLAQFAAAFSQNDAAGTGHLWQASFAHTDRRHGFTLNLQGADPAYRQIGQDDTSPSYRWQAAASYNYETRRFGSFGIGFAMVDSPARGRITTYSANYAFPVVKNGVLTVSAVRVLDPERTGNGTSVGVSFFMPLESDLTLSSNANFRGGSTEAFASVSKGISADVGVGWRALSGYRQEEAFAEGGIYLQSSHSLATIDVSASRTRQTMRAGLQGGIVWADGRVFATRRVIDSFGIVEVPGYAGVGINVHGNVVARTDAEGRAMVPRLLAYQANDIRLDPSELPISAELDTIEQRAVPAARSAVKIVFPVRIGRGALVRIVLDDGQPAPAGAEVELVGDKQEFFVARRGEAFLTGLRDRNEVKLKWRGGSCTFTLVLPPGSPDDVARVGPLVCPGLKR